MKFNIFLSIVVYLIPGILCILAYRFKNKYLIYAFLVSTFLISAFRFNIATDFGRYYNRAFYRTALGLSLNEPIEMLFFYISSKAGLPRLFFMLNSAVVTICGYLLYVQYKDRARYELMFLAYYFIILAANFITRYCTAVAVCSIGVYFLINHTKHKFYMAYYILIALLSFCFHTGAIVALAYPVFLKLYNKIKHDKGITKFPYALIMGAIGLLLPLIGLLGNLMIHHISLFKKFDLYFIFFKQCIPGNIPMILVMALSLYAIGILFDILSISFSNNEFMKVFSIGSLLFIFFMVLPLFGGQYKLDVMRIGAIFGFNSMLLLVFVNFDNKYEKISVVSKTIRSFISTFYIGLILFSILLGSYYILPYNTDTTVPWNSDSTYVQKIIE